MQPRAAVLARQVRGVQRGACLLHRAPGEIGVSEDGINAGIEAGLFPDQDLDTTVPLVNACLSAHGPAGDAAARERIVRQTEQFVLRAVGAVAAESA